MATSGVRTYCEALLIIVFCASCVAGGVEKFPSTDKTWAPHTKEITLGKVEVLKLQTDDDNSILKNGNFKFSLTSAYGNKGSNCSDLITRPARPKYISFSNELLMYVRLRPLYNYEGGPAWMCTTIDGRNWYHHGPRSMVLIRR